MGFYLKLPALFTRFWFIDAPYSMLVCFASLNKAFLQVFSLPLLIATFFKPLKNEYRKGLVGFSIGMGIFVKSALIIADLFLFILLIGVELAIFVGFIAVPAATVVLLFLR